MGYSPRDTGYSPRDTGYILRDMGYGRLAISVAWSACIGLVYEPYTHAHTYKSYTDRFPRTQHSAFDASHVGASQNNSQLYT